MNHRTQSRLEKRKRQPDAAGTVLVCAESGAAFGAIAEAMRAGGAARFSLKRVLEEGDLHSALSAGPSPAVAVLPCGPETGLTEAILRHAFLLKLYGVRHLLLTVVDGGSGMDARQFDTLAARFRDFAGRAGVADADVVPLSALADRISGLAAAKTVPDLPLRLRVTAATPRAQHEWRCQGAIEGGAPQSGQAITAFPA